MEAIYEIYDLLKSSRALEYLGGGHADDPAERTLLQRFFDLILEKDRYDDDRAAAALYGKGFDGTHKPYQKLKHKFKYRLLNLLVVMEDLQPDYSTKEATIKTLYREQAIAQILSLKKSSSELSVEVFKRVYKHATKHQMLTIMEESAGKLATLYGLGAQKNHTKRKKFRARYYAHREANNAKQWLIDLYADTIEMYRDSPNQEIVRFLEPHVEKTKEIIANFKFHNVVYMGHVVLQAYYQLSKNSTAVIENAKAAIARLNTGEGALFIQISVFYIGQITVYAQLQDFDRALGRLDNLLSKLEPGSANYYRFQEHGILIALHAERYAEAIERYQQLNARKLKKSVSAQAYQEWMLLEAYLKLLTEMVPGLENAFGSKFRLAKLRNDTYLIARQKDTLNLHVYLLEFCFALVRRRHGQVIDRVEAFEKYVQRYLGAKSTPRAYYFCKSLVQIPRADFHAVRTHRYAKAYLKGLEETEVDENYYATFSEVIPYGTLWRMVCAKLKGFEYLDAGMLPGRSLPTSPSDHQTK
ncbi:hypothetical protein [Neolewinella antarctica]|uniref:Uncharacterized protein n=1 Tax=Neolewinella antarctica TaxID=442734 RepID=A0ABX0XG52_9BACT|nr:hypothetical protein [Neolewinella antarctica]NJC27889.1 hypothetical protein [Neolewinella antarctica]